MPSPPPLLTDKGKYGTIRGMKYLLPILLLLTAPLTRATEPATPPTDLSRQQQLCLAYLDLGLFEKAEECLNTIQADLDKLPPSAPAAQREHMQQVLAELRPKVEGRQAEMKAAYSKAHRTLVNYGPDIPPANPLPQQESHRLLQLALAYWELGRFSDAQRVLQETLAELGNVPAEAAERAALLDFITRMQQSIDESRAEYYKSTANGKDRSLLRRIFYFRDEVTKLYPVESACAMALEFAPQVTEWEIQQLNDDLVLLKGEQAHISGFGVDFAAIVLYAVQMTDAGSRCVLSSVEPATWLKQAQFRLTDNEIQAVLPDGTLLARYALWHTPPAIFAPAPQPVQLSYKGMANGTIQLHISNQSAHPIELAKGIFAVTALMADGSAYGAGTAFSEEPLLLQAHEQRTLKLRFYPALKAPDCPSSAQAVQVSFHVPEPLSDSPHICPPHIPCAGAPMLYGFGGTDRGLPAGEDTYLHLKSQGNGFVTLTCDIYRKENGLWKFSGQFICRPNSPGSRKSATSPNRIAGFPEGVRREGNTLQLLDAQGEIFATVEIEK